jgi:Uncharacterised nucleotidyltransferase
VIPDDNALARLLLASGLSVLRLPWEWLLDRSPAEYLTTRRGARKVVICARRAQMIPMLNHFLGPDGDSATAGVLPAMAAIYEVTLRKHLEGLRPLLAALKPQRIPVMILKGADLAISCYPRGLGRSARDIDLLVHRADLAAAEQIFRAQGFVQGSVNRRRMTVMPLPAATKHELERDHYELLPLMKLSRVPELDHLRRFLPMVWRDPLIVRNGRVHFVLNYDVHFNLAGGVHAEDSWVRPRRVELARGRSILAQAPSRLFWFIAARLYHETMRSRRGALRGLIDVLACVSRFRRVLDWDDVLFLADKYRVHLALLRVAQTADTVAEELIPGQVIDRLLRRVARSERDSPTDLLKALMRQGKRKVIN